MKLFILKTDIRNKKQVNQLRPVFESYAQIKRWTIDMHDVDRVLKVEASEEVEKKEMIQMVRDQGIFCEELPD